MIYELPVNIGKSEFKVFLQDDFLIASNIDSPLHDHFHTEVHIVSEGEFEFYVDNKVYTLSVGDIVAIPSRCLHWRRNKSLVAKCFAFSTDYEIKEMISGKIDKEILKSFVRETETCKITENSNKISAFISLFLCYVFDIDDISVKETNDYSYIINKFFEDNYDKDVTLADLAKEISFSQKQASRMVVKYTGNTFRTEIAKRRVTAGKILLQSGALSNEEIAHSLGYASYSCLWKAIKTFEE